MDTMATKTASMVSIARKAAVLSKASLLKFTNEAAWIDPDDNELPADLDARRSRRASHRPEMDRSKAGRNAHP